MFQEKVLALANVVMSSGVKNEVVNGSLFCEGCTVEEAVKLESAILDLFPVGVILSRFGNTSAFDFV